MLYPFHTSLVGFGGGSINFLGWVKLPLTLGMEPHQTTVRQDFIIVNCHLPYNAILGYPTLGKIIAISSTYHLMMKFLTSTGISEIRGDQKVSRQCFITAMKTSLTLKPSTK